MRLLRKIWMWVGFLVTAALVAGYLVFFFDFQPPMPRLHQASQPSPMQPAAAVSPDGRWSVAGDGRSFVGYRVVQKFMGVPIPEDAVGRTKVVAGSLTVAGASASQVDITADLGQLHSHKSGRDTFLHTKGLDTDHFPTATFHLTRPAAFEKVPALGEAVHASAEGDLTLHGVTRHVAIPVDAQWTGAEIEVVGHLTLNFADYGIQPATVAKVVRTEDHGDLEFDVFLRRG
ncbi:MAG: YceI family protein [Acidimicrobiia bacterium]